MFLQKIIVTILLSIIFLLKCCSTQQNLSTYCPKMFTQIFDGFAPVGNWQSGNFTQSSATDLHTCLLECCKKIDCNAAIFFNQKCFHVDCATDNLCLPKRKNETLNLQMVLVKPVSEDLTWLDVIKNAGLSDSIINNPTDEQNDINKYDMTSNNDLYRISSYMDKNTEDNFRNMYNTGFGRFAQYNDDGGDFQTDETKFYADTIFPCNLALEQSCPMNEECLPISMIKSRKGFCNCINDYQRNDQGKCVKSIDKLADKIYKIANDVGLDVDNNNNNGGENTNDAGTKPDLLIDPTEIDGKKLTVSINSKTVRLPEKEVQLAAYTIPDEKSSGDTYQYLWTLISQPSGEINGTMSDQRKDHVKLSNLSEGLYKFKVIVTGTNTNSYGETYANVTVLPEKHINKPPIVIITPVQQTVKLPTSNAILDGSTSTDDDKILSWHWDLIQGPIGYQPKLPETSTLLLDDLSAPGNYTFRLTIADSDGAKNSTTASITVLKIIDYPPEANAGSNVIVYLPHNNVTLNGSLSTDDRKIVAWEWTKDSNDVSKAVDMQDTRTPYLKLSNLEEGIYTFDLKVTDESNQSSSAKVHVFVKKPTNLPPIANAGTNITINLPKTWTILNGTQSSDNIKIIHYEWSLISGPPSEVKILNSTNVLANVTGLTIGQYIFQLYVNDENNNNATDQVWIKVVQEKNTPPIANAGGDQSVTLPTKTIYLNGTKSNDDFRIVNFTWTRDGSSLAMGTIVGDSNHEPVLIITNIVPGRYVFKLTVTDDQGLTGTDTVSIIVHPDPMLLNLVEITLSVGVSVLTQSELESLEQKLLLLLGDNTMLRVRELKTEYKTGEAVLVFYVEKTTSDSQIVLMSGFDVEKLLLDKFWKDSAILGTMISNVRTVLCQNTCSGHGVCNAETRACMCETFWMPDIFYFWGIREANCDWSILYVVIGVFVAFLCVSGICWGLTCLCRRTRKPRSRPKPQKYALLGTQEDEIQSRESNCNFTRGTSLSDSETDSDVLFESRSKQQNGILRSNNGSAKNGQQKYSITRLGRRIKT